MKVKLMYVFIIVVGLASIFLLYQKNEVSDAQLNTLSSEVVLLSEAVVLESDVNAEVETLSIKEEIESEILILKENVEILQSLKESFNEDFTSVSQRDKIYIGLSLREIAKYRSLYQETTGSIYNILEPFEGQYDLLSEEEIESIRTQIVFVQNYRLVLVAKANEEILTLIDILNTYK
jgi:hypothetical protein